MTNLKRLRWAVRAVLALGVAASVAGNVLHAQDHIVSRVIAGWPPLALWVTVELIARVPVHSRRLAVARLAATALIASIAAWVSYWHMVGVALRYGETSDAAHMIPLSVDGLVVVAAICLVELGGRIRDAEALGLVDEQMKGSSVSTPVRMVFFDYALPIGPERPPVSDRESDSTRRRSPTNEARVVAAHRRTPNASDEQLAARLGLSKKTIERYRPAKLSDKLSDSNQVNGRKPDLQEVST